VRFERSRLFQIAPLHADDIAMRPKAIEESDAQEKALLEKTRSEPHQKKYLSTLICLKERASGDGHNVGLAGVNGI
jgi:hypothetical protein